MQSSLQPRRFVRVAIVSDTHGFLDDRIASVIETCDLVVHAGDIGNYSVLQDLQTKTSKVIAVAGNNDIEGRWSAHEAHIVKELPKTAELDLPGGKLVVEHGERHGFHSPCHTALREAHPGAKVIVYGHTHKLVCDKNQIPWVINPGAAGRTRTHGGPSCLVLIADENQWSIQINRFEQDEAAA
jgi:putative phosphoesterase